MKKEEAGHEESTGSSEKRLSPWEPPYSRFWNKIFLASCVIGVSIDPLFLYIPIINEDLKCLDMDQNIKIVALILRSLTDCTYVLHLFFRLKTALAMSKVLQVSISVGAPWFYILINILAILPIPQVIVIQFFSEIAGSRSLTTRKFMNTLLLFQYVPRILCVYIYAKDLEISFNSHTRVAWVKGTFNFFLYIIVGHVFGALWYFHSIFRETACWHHACNKDPAGCIPNHFYCSNPNSTKNLTYFKELCPVDPPNSTVFDFGIFTDAIESRILGKTNFLRKFSRSFWWGVQTLSSFGQNLKTSRSIEENFFAVLISILGLLIFLYLVGNLQKYMQSEPKKWKKARKKMLNEQREIESYLSHYEIHRSTKKAITRYLYGKIKEEKDFDVKYIHFLLKDHIKDKTDYEKFFCWITKLRVENNLTTTITEQRAELWIKESFPKDLGKEIMKYIRIRLQNGKDVEIKCDNILLILPDELKLRLKKHLCKPILKKVPMLQNMHEQVHEAIFSFLKPLTFAKGKYIIRKGEPLDMILFITQGTVWTFGSNTNPMERIQQGDYYGNELIEWRMSSTSYSKFPISTCNLKSHTKVEAFALMAIDLENVLVKYLSKFSHMYSTNESISENLKPLAANILKSSIRRYIIQKREKVNSDRSNQVSVDMDKVTSDKLSC